LPHKQAALAIVDKLEPLARRIGAVNTIIVMPTVVSKAATPTLSAFAKICASGRRTGRPRWDRRSCSAPAAGRVALSRPDRIAR